MAAPPALTLLYLLPAAVAFVTTIVGTKLLAPRLVRSGIIGYDVHKENQPARAEMGGVAIFAGIIAGASTALAVATFGPPLILRSHLVSAAMATIGIVAVIGIMDDLVEIRQSTKALLPAFSSLPLMAVAAGESSMFVPVFGTVDLGLWYPLLIIPLAITGATNATNMLAGWNGLEAGLGLIMFSTLGVYGAWANNATLLAIALPCAFACMAFLAFNWHPAEVFPGDVGALTIGAAFASAVIIANVEFLGAILMLPYVLDLAMKARHRFPKTFAARHGDVLTCPTDSPPKGLGQLFLRVTGGMRERSLVTSLLAFEAICAAAGLYVLIFVVGV